MVEAVTATLFLLVFWHYGLSVTSVGFWFLSACLVAVFFIDLEWWIIPDAITIPGIILGITFSLVSDDLTTVSSALGILVGGGSLFALGLLGHILFKKESLGMGDIKLAAMLGAFLGTPQVLLVLISSALLGLLVSLIVMSISARFREKRLLPYGPFLVLAALLVIFYGQDIIDWYSKMFLAF